MQFGYDNAVFSGIIVSPWFLATFNHPSSRLIGTMSSVYNVGCAIGAICALMGGSICGRRRSLLSGCFVAAIGVIIQATSIVVSQLLVGRIVTGVGVGILTSTIGLWQAETSPARSRGRYTTLELSVGGWGLIVAQWMNYGLRNNTGPIAFVLPIALQLVFILGAGVLVFFLPESPHWLFKNERQAESLRIIIRLEGAGASQDSPAVKQHMLEIAEASKLEGTEKNFFSLIFTNGPTQNFRRIALGTGIMIFHQLNGINSVTYYVPTLVTKFINVSHGTSLWISGLTSIIVIMFSPIPVLFVDRLGRRPFLWIGSVAQMVCFIIVAALLATAPATGNSVFGIATLAFTYLYYAINMSSWYPIGWVYSAELMPLRAREKGMGIAVFFYWILQFMIVEITPIAITNIGYKFYIILACFNAAIAVIIFSVYPETKQKSLEEIDFYFAKKFHNGAELSRVTEEMRAAQDVELELKQDFSAASDHIETMSEQRRHD